MEASKKPDHPCEGDKVVDSPIGAGTLTASSSNGYPRVNGKPTSWVIVETENGRMLFDPKHIYRTEEEKIQKARPKMDFHEHILKPGLPTDETTAAMVKEHRYLTDKTNFAMIIAAGLRGGKTLIEVDAMLTLYRHRTGIEMSKKVPKETVPATPKKDAK